MAKETGHVSRAMGVSIFFHEDVIFYRFRALKVSFFLQSTDSTQAIIKRNGLHPLHICTYLLTLARTQEENHFVQY